MDLKETKEKKQKLEFDILHLLTEFQKETGVYVEKVCLHSELIYDKRGMLTGLTPKITVGVNYE